MTELFAVYLLLISRIIRDKNYDGNYIYAICFNIKEKPLRFVHIVNSCVSYNFQAELLLRTCRQMRVISPLLFAVDTDCVLWSRN
jgi:hypothetical protein